MYSQFTMPFTCRAHAKDGRIREAVMGSAAAGSTRWQGTPPKRGRYSQYRRFRDTIEEGVLGKQLDSVPTHHLLPCLLGLILRELGFVIELDPRKSSRGDEHGDSGALGDHTALHELL